jgi:uncharacterized low-complexity protein
MKRIIMKKHSTPHLTALIGATLASSLSATVNAGENPFALKELAGGYMQNTVAAEGTAAAPAAAPAPAASAADAAKGAKEGKCGEGKCGAEMMKSPEMKCGAGMATMKKEEPAQSQKAIEGKCAGMKMDAPAPAK